MPVCSSSPQWLGGDKAVVPRDTSRLSRPFCQASTMAGPPLTGLLLPQSGFFEKSLAGGQLTTGTVGT